MSELARASRRANKGVRAVPALLAGLPTVLLLLVASSALSADTTPNAITDPVAASSDVAAPLHVEWTHDNLLDRIQGAWAGKMVGVVVGTPVEFRSCGKIHEGPLGWDLPTSIALYQDDLYVNMVFLEVLDREGIAATQGQFAAALRDSQFPLFHANLAARRALLLGIPPPLSGRPPHNLHADDIDFQIEADFIGLVCPALPRAASDIAFRVGPIINYGDGVYGGVFVANLYALAFYETEPIRVVERALESLPADSTYRRCIETVLEHYRKDPKDWRAAWKAVGDQWDGHDRCPGGIASPFNIDAAINGAYVVIGFLFGDKDPVRTIEIATRCGQDADCNPSTAMGVLGTMLGYSALPEEWRAEIEPIRDRTFSHVPYTFDSVSSVSLRLALAMIERNGGTVGKAHARVEAQSPTPPEITEQWNDGLVPIAAETFRSRSWKWTGQWQTTTARGSQVIATQTPGASGEIEFEGEGAMLIGCLIESGGQLEIQLDDRPSTVVETYLFPRGGMSGVYPQEGLWYSGPIPDGRHRLRVRLLGSKHAESKGTVTALESLIVYRTKPK